MSRALMARRKQALHENIEQGGGKALSAVEGFGGDYSGGRFFSMQCEFAETFFRSLT